eukprot:CAMPEP_0167758172 /NCGR_PEP_ID=MMETSP0110_2-20121227/10325_1 /TAXON_ID=629695 /ORGANISM="Gymnochlora sp., Strain CCMP2014" /LENGTH=308 /DNA_ID=CAMNT_0007644427 /DNA_START=215 /DNA_END=1141 /DNA_ORIENTATION=+
MSTKAKSDNVLTTDEETKQAIREVYGSVARTGSSLVAQGSHGKQATASCCGEADADPLELAKQLGYTEEELKSVPEGSNMGLGCGNTRTIANYKPGDVVVDLGSGGGLDAFIAAPFLLPGGRAIGIDMTPDMVHKARANRLTDLKKYKHCEFRLGEIEHIPVGDNTATCIVSNCVINLSTSKQSVFNEAFRILRPGGRLAISDIVMFKEMPDEMKKDKRLVCGCMGGCAMISDLKDMMTKAGFTEISIKEKKGFSEIIKGWAPDTGVENYVTSCWIEAVKPEDATFDPKASLDTPTPDSEIKPKGKSL